ncbi:MAG TPA: DUF72 domain-containing protein [Chthonomonadaceae bacterium]|nr:DUF72 domain-containing protein [Chthonomonadaceae bacterium]
MDETSMVNALENAADSMGRRSALARADRLHIPVSVGGMGWSYEDWDGVFYPADATSKDWLRLYAQAFDAVEIDSTFYGTPRPATIRNWMQATPPGFVFCSKVPRLVTHELGLRDAAAPLAQFIHAMAAMGARRGPMLFQMPPSFTIADLPALESLVPALRSLADPHAEFAIEFRHASLIVPDVFALLAEHNVALVASDYRTLPRRFARTADFAYIRLIGRHGAFRQHRAIVSDRSASIRQWADVLLRGQHELSRAWIFCNNDYEGFAPATCRRVQGALGVPARSYPCEAQGSLF